MRLSTVGLGVLMYTSAFAVSFALGCQDDGGGDGSEDDGCDCPAGEYAWYCGVIDPAPDATDGCAETAEAAQTACTNWLMFKGYTSEFQFGAQLCDELGDTETGGTGTGNACTGWSPSSNVTYNPASGKYEVDQDFADSIMGDPSQLVSCDDAYTTVHASAPVYGIENISSGDLADLLGLQDGDRFVSINGVDLDSKDDLIGAVVDLWLSGETDFSLVVSRSGTSPFTLYYKLVP